MSRAGKKDRRKKGRPYYPLTEVCQKIDSGKFLINDNAKQTAEQDFSWKHDDVKRAYKLLKRKHFIKTEYSEARPGFVIDCYRGHIRGEDVYTHFYIDDNGKLVINSFKQDNTR